MERLRSRTARRSVPTSEVIGLHPGVLLQIQPRPPGFLLQTQPYPLGFLPQTQPYLSASEVGRFLRKHQVRGHCFNNKYFLGGIIIL